MGSKAAELYLTYSVLLWHTYMLNAGKKLFVLSTNVKQRIFFFACLKYQEKCYFYSDEEKKRNSVPI